MPIFITQKSNRDQFHLLPLSVVIDVESILGLLCINYFSIIELITMTAWLA
jgi:hypothetical protein